MIDRIRIKNFKSIDKLQIDLGRVNVVIGANGSGKSNLLEAIAFGFAAGKDDLSNEYLGNRGLRLADSHFMRAAFNKSHQADPVSIELVGDGIDVKYSIRSVFEKGYDLWRVDGKKSLLNVRGDADISLGKRFKNLSESDQKVLLDKFFQSSDHEIENSKSTKGVLKSYSDFLPFIQSMIKEAVSIYSETKSPDYDFITYSPENNKIRNFHSDSQIEPLGVYGEGLFKLLSKMSEEELAEIREHLHFVDWFEDIQVPTKDELAPFQKTIRIKDRFIDENLKYFDQRSANEGFLFLLFYLTVIVSDLTPKFFAIDNIDNALNPKLCRNLVRVMVKLAKKYDKQIILTTHNPAILDGINLDDPEQKILVTYRNAEGATRIDYVKKGTPVEGVESVKLSEQFLRGYLGGLNQGGF